jgi:hypothetical protein
VPDGGWGTLMQKPLDTTLLIAYFVKQRQGNV